MKRVSMLGTTIYGGVHPYVSYLNNKLEMKRDAAEEFIKLRRIQPEETIGLTEVSARRK